MFEKGLSGDERGHLGVAALMDYGDANMAGDTSASLDHYSKEAYDVLDSAVRLPMLTTTKAVLSRWHTMLHP